MAGALYTTPASHVVLLDPSLRTAGEVVSERTDSTADGYPELANGPDALTSRSLTPARDDTSGGTSPTEIAP